VACLVLATLRHAVDQAQPTLDAVLTKMRFWQRWAAPGSAALNERQAKLVNRLLDGFEGKLTSSKWERSPSVHRTQPCAISLTYWPVASCGNRTLVAAAPATSWTKASK